MATALVNTKTAKDRRELRYGSIADLRRDIDRLAEADRAGTLRRCGNWTLGQALGHLSAWLDFAYEGFPVRPPRVVGWILRLRRGKYLREGLPAGVRIPGIEGGTLGTEPRTLDEGLGLLRASLDRLERSDPAHPSPLFGPMTREECVEATLRHAELHLSFFHPERE
ncbi:MAG TPA: DUF1569 domain-containing protein [Phycisphaerales bacterium]|nr:DUF1569 domain-containing protein [Phycisphaerales bacterium]